MALGECGFNGLEHLAVAIGPVADKHQFGFPDVHTRTSPGRKQIDGSGKIAGAAPLRGRTERITKRSKEAHPSEFSVNTGLFIGHILTTGKLEEPVEAFIRSDLKPDATGHLALAKLLGNGGGESVEPFFWQKTGETVPDKRNTVSFPPWVDPHLNGETRKSVAEQGG